MPPYAYAILSIGWLIWCLPFFLAKQNTQPAKEVDRRARWGILLVAVSYTILWQTKFWLRPLSAWRLSLSILFLLLACLLSWTGARALGRQWRIDAGLSSDHQLVTSGPYRFVRHPIYTSLLCMLLGVGFMVTPLLLLVVALLVLIIGTEIRVSIEDHLLATHFGDRFREYQRSVPAYIPFLK